MVLLVLPLLWLGLMVVFFGSCLAAIHFGFGANSLVPPWAWGGAALISAATVLLYFTIRGGPD